MRASGLLLLVALPLSAQSVRARLEGRVPTSSIGAIDSLVRVAAMENLPRQCDAWLDFLATFDELLRQDVKGGTFDIGVPQDIWDYWLQVAKGESQDYDILGIREIDD